MAGPDACSGALEDVVRAVEPSGCEVLAVQEEPERADVAPAHVRGRIRVDLRYENVVVRGHRDTGSAAAVVDRVGEFLIRRVLDGVAVPIDPVVRSTGLQIPHGGADVIPRRVLLKR